MSLADFERVPLLFGPSPVHRLERLGEHLGGGVEIWAKREDCNSGLAYGGNKVRKLEYLAADALAQGCDTLVSIGGVQSNHTRQVAAVAARLGLRCVLVQEHWVDWPDVVYDKVGNILLSRIMGADVRLDPAGFDIGIRKSWEDALASVEESGGKPYAIPAGASDHPLGGLGFARWADEVAEQERELGVFFDTDRRVLGDRLDAGRDDRRLRGAGDTARRCSASTARRPSRRRGIRSRASRGAPPRRSGSGASCATRRSSCSTSGTPAPTASPTRRRSRRSGSAPASKAMLTDPVYEGKSMAALIDLVRDGRIAPGSRVLYAHLGGQPALNAYAGAVLSANRLNRYHRRVSSAAAVHVRDAAPDDAAAIAVIGAEGFSGSYATILAPAVIEAVIEQTYSRVAVADCVRRCVAAPDAEFLVAERDEQVVGFLHFDSEGPNPELHRIYVDPTRTGGGIGAALLDELHRRLPASASYILMVLAPNTGAIRFYENHGLEIERDTDAVSHYKDNMGFVPPDTPPVPALIMRYQR